MSWDWFLKSNRWKHFVFAIPFGALFSPLFTAGIGTGMEFKDVHHANGDKPMREWDWSAWDWIDWLCTFFGGMIGFGLMLGFLALIR